MAGEALWSLGDIPYGAIARERVAGDMQLLYLLASASLIEMASDLDTHHLTASFAADAEAAQWLQGCWEPEERQHGLALKRYVQAAWPDFDWDAAYRGFLAEFSDHSAMGALQPSRALELAARCVVETITASFYGMLAAAEIEPVLTQLALRIRADEIRHYKHFYRFFRRYRARAPLSRVAVPMLLMKRAAEIQSGEAPIAFKHVYRTRHPGAAFCRRDYVAYRDRVRRLARRHLNRDMAVKLLLKPLGWRGWTGRAAHALALSLLGAMLGRLRRPAGTAPRDLKAYRAGGAGPWARG